MMNTKTTATTRQQMRKKELNEVMSKLAKATEDAKLIRELDLDNSANGGVSKKFYARRTEGISERHYRSDNKSEKQFDFILSAIEEVFNIRISRTILIRRAIEVYSEQFIELMSTGKMSKDLTGFLEALINEKHSLCEAAGKKIK